MATLHASTPPPPSSIRTPTTPRFGFQDDYQPFSPRKSKRVASQARAQTPPPQSYTRHKFTPRSSRKRVSAENSDNPSSPSSPQTATKKRVPRNPATMAGRRVSGALNSESTASAASSLGLAPPKIEQHRSMGTVRGMGMLPTPDKTPKKAPTEVAPQVKAIARSLFSSRSDAADEVMPTPSRNRSKKYSGFTIGSFEGDEDNNPIAIFTDSNDRIPEVDNSLKNPFYGPGSQAVPEPVKRSSKRRKISIPGEGDISLEEAEKREDGIVVVFRGKKIFKKFEDLEDDGLNDVDNEDEELEQSSLSRSRTRERSNLKPRLLFGPAKSHNTEDEEADTEIEDAVSTPTRQATSMAATPKAPRFAPASPPTTSRATRSKDVHLSSPPVAPSEDDSHTPTHRNARGSNVSPFDTWQRSKGLKREGDDLVDRGGDKRLRR